MNKDKSVFSNNIKLVQDLYSAFERKDFQTILNMLSSEVELSEPENPFNPACGTKHGHDGFLEWLNIGKQNEEILALHPQKYLVDNDSVAVVGYTKCLAKPTGKIYESDFVHLITIKDEKIVLFKEFFDTYIAGEAFRKI